MYWLNKTVDELMERHPKGEILVSSGVSPSGPYHIGTLREVLTAEVIARELKRRGRQATHIHVLDDLDVFRKVPSNLPEKYQQYLGKPLCDIPAPDGSSKSYADYYLNDLLIVAEELHLEMDILRASEKYREGFFTAAIEKALSHIDTVRRILETISGRQLDSSWSPIQVIEDGYLKNREFASIDEPKKTITYKDVKGENQVIGYDKGQVKLNWRIDWPARWALLGVKAEPFGRDHATKGGSYDTGAELVRQVYDAEPPLPVPYDFINRTGATKKMSKSAGDTITAADLLRMLPAEVVWFFILRYPPQKQLFFDEGESLIRLVDQFSELLAKPDKTDQEKQLVELCLQGVTKPTISRIPFSHLAASYQASLKDADKTLEVIRRTEYAPIVDEEADTIKAELKFIDEWLNHWAPEELKFELVEQIDANNFNEQERQFLSDLADKVATAPEAADGDWFHKAVYEFKDTSGMEPKQMFETLYRLLIGKNSGPRAGWFLSILSREWLIKRLRLEV